MDTSVFWLSPQGHDGGDGSAAHPFATLERARAAVRQLREDHDGVLPAPVRVCLRAGVYPRREPLVLGPLDSGTPTAPVTWCAETPGTVTLSGGATLTGWQPASGSILRAPAPERVAWWGPPRQLFYRGQRQRRSRWPKYDPANPLAGGWIVPEGPDPDLDVYQTLRYPPGALPRQWQQPCQAEVNLYGGYGWCNAVVPLLGIDYERRTVRLGRRPIDEDQQPWFFSMRMTTHNRFYIENVREELTQPGEWCYDGAEQAVYFWPPESGFDADAVTMPEVDCLVRLQQAEWVHLLGLGFACTTTGDDYHRQAVQQGLGAMNSQQGTRYCGEAVHLRDTRHCAVEQCVFDQVGGNAIYLERHNLRAAVRRNRITGSGFNGVVLAGDRVFHPLFCQVTDNEITQVGRIINYVAGVFLGLSDGCVVAHNSLHDLPHHAVNLGSNGMGRNYIEANDIRRVCMEIHDTGAINCWMDVPGPWVENQTERSGHVIRGNLIVDVAGCIIDNGRVVADPSTRGIYLDDYTSNCLVWGNVIVRAGWAFQIHGGKHNLIENNILLDCRTAMAAGGWVSHRPGLAHTKVMFRGNRFCRNIISTSRADGVTYVVHDWTEATLERCDDNVLHHAGPIPVRIEWGDHPEGWTQSDLDQWRSAGFDRHSSTADPLFADPANLDFSLPPESPALALGFVPITLAGIGVRPAARPAEAAGT